MDSQHCKDLVKARASAPDHPASRKLAAPLQVKLALPVRACTQPTHAATVSPCVVTSMLCWGPRPPPGSVAEARAGRCLAHQPCTPRRRFWQCPNGKECKYRHRLPPGFKLKSEIRELLASEAANKPSLEEEIEAQRQAVEAQTPITETVRSGLRVWSRSRATI